MRRLLVAICPLLVLLAPTAVAAGSDDKVTGGSPVQDDQFPGVVALVVAGSPAADGQYCGGTLITADWVLTAASCIFNGPGVADEVPDVLVGTRRLDGTGRQIRTDRSVLHPGFRNPASPNGTNFPTDDLALLHLAEPATGIPLAPLALPGHDVLEVPETLGFVTGWGAQSDEPGEERFPIDLLVARVPVIADADCIERLGDGSVDADNAGRIVCAGLGGTHSVPDTDSCVGDGGGPLWAKASLNGRLRQIGIVSGGPTCGSSPTYYTSVQRYTDFIEATIGVQLASFPDIVGIALEREVETLTVNGVAAGNAAGLFDPGGQTSRAQLATFVNRVVDAPSRPPGAPHPYRDVDGSGVHDANIEALYDSAIAPREPDFRPGANATRAEMAGFIARAVELPPVADGPFADVPPDSSEAGAINALAEAGIALVGPDRLFRPDDPISRAQIAAFLVRAFPQLRGAPDPEPPATTTSTTTTTRPPTTTTRPTTTTTRPPTTTTSAPGRSCHPSYPDFCIPPPPPDLDCGDLGSLPGAHANFRVVGSDVHGFDADGNGRGCESGVG